MKTSKEKPVEEVNDGQFPSECDPDELPSECESDGYDSDELRPAKKRICHFLDDEASGSDNDEEENGEGDLDGFIDNKELNNGASFYHADQMRHREEIDNYR